MSGGGTCDTVKSSKLRVVPRRWRRLLKRFVKRISNWTTHAERGRMLVANSRILSRPRTSRRDAPRRSSRGLEPSRSGIPHRCFSRKLKKCSKWLDLPTLLVHPGRVIEPKGTFGMLVGYARVSTTDQD